MYETTTHGSTGDIGGFHVGLRLQQQAHYTDASRNNANDSCAGSEQHDSRRPRVCVGRKRDELSSTAVINFSGVAQTTNQVSGTQLTATIAAADIATAGTAAVTVTNPGTAGMGAYGSGGTAAATSGPMTFTIN